MRFENVTVFCFLASYALAFLLELSQFVKRSAVVRWGTLGFALAGLLAQTIYLIVRSRQLDLPPLLGSTHDWFLVLTWMTIALYICIQVWNRELSIGIFVLPLALILVVASRYVNQTANPRILTGYWWSLFHASLWVFGMLSLSLALLVSLMYLLQHYRLKNKKAESPALHLLSLERLGRLNWWLVVISVPLLTLGMGTGLYMSYLASKTAQPVSLVNLTFLTIAVMWTAMAMLFGWLLVAKHATGRLVAIRTLLACTFWLVALLVIKLLSTDGIHA